ncbi:hypothetical protein HD806DRAFT_548668 [Xylariaceae sp. AK1471]|nr:hypothetical protein HD806DRAFT_548668 [Xylariaceae sp. AK1471]
MSELMHAGGISLAAFIGTGTTLIVISSVFVAARLVGSVAHSRKLLLDDYIAILAILLLVSSFALFVATVQGLADPTPSVYQLGQLATASNFISGASTWTAKAPILFFYIRIFGIKKWLRVISYVVLVVSFAVILAVDAYVGAQCNPNVHVLGPNYLAGCANAGSLAGIITSFFSTFTDAIIFILPIPVVLSLQLPLHKKIGLSIVFLNGIFAIVASAVTLYFKWVSRSGTGVDIKAAMISTIIEISIAIAVGCVPSLAAFWTLFVVKSMLYSKIKSSFSSTSFRTTKPKQSHPSVDGHSASTDRIYVTHRYDVIHDGDSINKSAGPDYITPQTIQLQEIRRP